MKNREKNLLTVVCLNNNQDGANMVAGETYEIDLNTLHKTDSMELVQVYKDGEQHGLCRTSLLCGKHLHGVVNAVKLEEENGYIQATVLFSDGTLVETQFGITKIREAILENVNAYTFWYDDRMKPSFGKILVDL